MWYGSFHQHVHVFTFKFYGKDGVCLALLGQLMTKIRYAVRACYTIQYNAIQYNTIILYASDQEILVPIDTYNTIETKPLTLGLELAHHIYTV